MPKTYELGPDNAWIRCGKCGLTSTHPRDIEERFCAYCAWFHPRTEAQMAEELKPCFAHRVRSCPKCEQFRAKDPPDA